MLKSIFIEDVFIEFYNQVAQRQVLVQPQDSSAIESFCRTITNGNGLTQNQANYLLKILQKYKNQAKMQGLDYSDAIHLPSWKKEFRVLDLSRKIFVELDENNCPWVCMKFPFQLKKEFEEEFASLLKDHNQSSWDSDRKLRKVSLYHFNLLQINDFATKHSFAIDETFLNALAEVEEIWQNSDFVLTRSTISSDGITLINSNEYSNQYWQEHSTGNLTNDLILAKSMGFILNKKPESLVEKIAASSENTFWIKDLTTFATLCKEVSGKVCIILDRAADQQSWIESFTTVAKNVGIPTPDIKICFRAEKHENPAFNNWIKEQGYGGTVKDGKILIFKHKPPKWLFTEKIPVTILATNNLYQPTSHMTKSWFDSHPCVMYVSDVKPSMLKEGKIVEL